MKSLLIIGTSHTQDNHSDYDNSHYDKIPWTHYLCDKLKLNSIDLSVGSFGINTYMMRILSSYKNCQYALLEIPSSDRYEIAIQQNKNYTDGYFFNEYFWQQERWGNDLYRLTSADAYQKHSSKDKFHEVNKNAHIKIDAGSVQTFLEIKALAPYAYKHDLLYSNVIAIDAFLKQNSIVPFWFSFNNNKIDTYDYSNFNLINSCINMLDIKDYMEQQYNLSEDNPDHYADKCHMNSVYWRMLVDKIFVKYMREKL